MKIELIDQYSREEEVEFDGDKYLVRDNGAVYRKLRPGRRRSKHDENWTFGRYVTSSRYMYIGSHAVHRIVAFAFLGSPPSEKHIVDHIDTDRSNNCATNLRWVTQLDNLIRHPSLRKRIISAYGSLDNFFEDPRAATTLDPSIDWLRTVSKEEAERSRAQLIKWGESDGRPTGGDLVNRVYGTQQAGPPIPELELDIQSLTPMAVQRRWKTPTEFPGCPNILGSDPLTEYAHNLRNDVVFSRNKYNESLVVMAEQGDAILSVLTSFRQYAVKPWAVAKVTIENGKFVHESIGSFFDENGAKKAHFGLLGIPFSGESFDDYC